MNVLKWVAVGLLVLLVVIQLFRPDRVLPPVDATRTINAQEPVPRDVDTLLRRACYDCHSYETRWPWYSQLAPVSWLLADDVKEGRRHLNFSDWASYPVRRRLAKLSGISEQVAEHEMPLPIYLLMHKEARLTDGERGRLVAWADSLRVQERAAGEGHGTGEAAAPGGSRP